MAVCFTGVHHVSLVVSDIERARDFYGNLLGLREIPRPSTFDFYVVWYDLGGQHIHLIPRETPDVPSPRHFALHVADAKAAREHFAKHSVSIREGTPIPGCDRFFVNDPDGNLIEVMQWFRPYCPATDGACDGQVAPPAPADRYEPGRTSASNRAYREATGADSGIK